MTDPLPTQLLVGLGARTYSRAKKWLRRNVDDEILLGLGTIVLLGGSLALTVLGLLFSWPKDPGQRFLLATAASLLAITLVASQWSRRSFLNASGLVLVALAVTVVNIGWDARSQVSPRELTAALDQRTDLLRLESEKRVALDKQVSVARQRLDAAISGSSSDDLKKSAENIAKVLATSKNPTTDTANDVAAMRRLAGPGDNHADQELYEAALDRVVKTQALIDYEPDQGSLDATIKKACAEVPAKPKKVAESCAAFETADVAQALATLDVAVATFRNAVDPTEVNAAALKTQTEAAAKQAAGHEITWLDAAARAPAAIMPGNSLDALVPGPLGWAIMVAALFAFWTSQQRRNAVRLTGPVEITTKAEGDAASTMNHFRFALLHNVPEPGAVPGAESLDSVSSLVELAGAPAAGVAKAVTAFVKQVLGRTYGYAVSIDAMQIDGDTPAAPQHRVMVRVSDRYTKQSIDSKLIKAAEQSKAYREAGFWAAGTILARSRRQPSWLRWSPDTAEPLALTSGSQHPTVEELKLAVRQAPDSALLLNLLGAAYETKGKQISALESYARAVTLAPQFLAARYRLAGGFGMLAGTPTVWTGLPTDERLRLCRLLVRSFSTMNTNRDWEGPISRVAMISTERAEAPINEVKAALVALAVLLHEDIAARASRASVGWALLRRSERDALWPMMFDGSRLHRQREVARLARWVAELQLPKTPTAADSILRSLVEAAKEPGSWWQLSYNAACGHAVAAQLETALTLLEQCLIRPGVYQLKTDWLRTDPDLALLHGTARFNAVAEHLGGIPK